MASPDIRAHLLGLVGQTIPTLTGRPNTILAVRGDDVIVGTDRSPQGQPVPISDAQAAADEVYSGGHLHIAPGSVGYRSAFVGAVLRSLPDVETAADPPSARLRRPTRRRNPTWENDELILALDLYLRRGQPDQSDPEVIALSGLLNRLPLHADRPDSERFRNPNGVHMKLGNFRRLDPSYSGRGLERGGAGEQLVWERFASNPDELAAAVRRISASAEPDARPEVAVPQEDEDEVVEGRVLYRLHRARERDPAVVKRKKAAVLQATGRLACEVCDFDFASTYGDLGEGFIECHHTLPLASGAERRTRLADLALVCPNCHRMLHRSRVPLAVAELRQIVRPG